MDWAIMSRAMFDPPWKKPPQCPEDRVTVGDICELLGVPREIAVSAFQRHIYSPALVVFNDDETAAFHREPLTDPALRELFGEINCSEGSFQPALRKMMQECHPGWRKGLAKFQAKVAITCVASIVKNGEFNWHAASTNLVDDTLLFDANQHSYKLPPLSRPRVLIDYGPGLGGRFVMKEHLNALAKGRPFVYVPITRGPFITTFLISYVSTLMTQESMSVYMNNGFFVPREEGIGAATSYLVRAAPGQADVIFCSGLQNVDKGELRAGIVNAYPLLRDGGVFLLRSQKNREPAESSTIDDMLEIAFVSGFSPQSAQFFYSISGKGKPVLTAILIKS
jgi:hypothetical protein